MNTNLDKYKPVNYLVFTTNALRNNEGDGTLDYYDRYINPISGFVKENSPFNNDNPQFCYYGNITVGFNYTPGEIISKAKSLLGSMITKQRKNRLYPEEVLLLLCRDSEGQFKLNVVFHDKIAKQWSMEPFDDLAFDSDLTDKQINHIMSRLTDFYKALQDNPKIKIADLQEKYLSWY